MKITKRSITASSQYVRAAEEDEEFDDFGGDDVDGVMDALDDVADSVEEIQDDMEDIDDDAIDIALNNNIANRYIAECGSCQGVFISAVSESDQDIDHVTGVCPLCGKDSDQYLKWIIRDVNSKEGQLR